MNELLVAEESWSPALKAAVEFAWLNRGKLHLQGPDGWSHNRITPPLIISHAMVENLVSAGLAVFSSFRWKGKHRFPVEVELTILPPPPPGVRLETVANGVRYVGADGAVILEHPLDCTAARAVVIQALNDVAAATKS